MTEPEARLCGIRVQRGTPVAFVDANGHDVQPGQVVAVDLAGRETLAIVVFAPRQLLDNEPGIGSAGRVLRAATHAESTAYIRGGSENAGEMMPRTDWLAAPGDEAAVRLATEPGEPTAAEIIERLFPTARREASRRTPGSRGRPDEA